MSNSKGYKKLSTKCICLISEMILRNLSWANSTSHLTPIVEAAFLHDMALTDALAKIKSEEDIVALNITDEKEIHMIQNHAQFAHFKIGMFPQVSNETKKILIGHHGAHNGVGFSTDLSALTKLTATFIVAEELAHHIITSETEKVKMNAIINFILEKYNHQSVVVDAIESFKKAFH